MKRILLSLIIILHSSLITLHSHAHEILSDHIQTLQVVAGDRWMDLPIIQLNGEETINISFDDMTHDYHRYSYSIQHCEADWSLSEGLFETEYIDGMYSSLTIDDYEQSLNMATLYTHYRLQIPNQHCRLKMSGNYMVTIVDDDSGEEILKACFMVCEPKMSVGMEMVTNTDIDFNHAHQQLNINVGYNSVAVTDPDRQLQIYALQNNRWSTMRQLPRAQFTSREGQQWQHCRDLIFPATNEYHKFEYLDIHRNSLGVDRTGFDGSNYHVWINTDYPRPNYVYDEDANGAYYIRNTDNYNNDTESEYFIAHFTYKTTEQFDGDVYLNGMWTYDSMQEQYRMQYDEESHSYQCAVPLKMGYYSYQYVLQRPDGTIVYLPSEGNYYETENRYSCLVYYKPTASRTFLLYGATTK